MVVFRGLGSVLLLLLSASVGCRSTRSGPIIEQPAAQLDTTSLDALVAVGDGGYNEILFGIRDARTAGWSSAPVVRVPSAIGIGPVGPVMSLSASGAVDSLHLCWWCSALTLVNSRTSGCRFSRSVVRVPRVARWRRPCAHAWARPGSPPFLSTASGHRLRHQPRCATESGTRPSCSESIPRNTRSGRVLHWY